MWYCDIKRVGGEGVRCGFHQSALYSCMKFSNYEKNVISLMHTHMGRKTAFKC